MVGRSLVGACGTALFAYVLAVRPWHTRWGTQSDEATRPLPGDELVPSHNIDITRAITIRAPAEAVWPWLVQIGQARGGFYSYTWLENAFGLDIHNAERIEPDLQQLAVGDIVKLAPRGSDWVVSRLEPPRALVLHLDSARGIGEIRLRNGSVNTSWGFYLEPGTEPGTTRLLVRWRGNWRLGAGWMLLAGSLEPAHFVMERKMLLGIKARVEDGTEGMPARTEKDMPAATPLSRHVDHLLSNHRNHPARALLGHRGAR